MLLPSSSVSATRAAATAVLVACAACHDAAGIPVAPDATDAIDAGNDDLRPRPVFPSDARWLDLHSHCRLDISTPGGQPPTPEDLEDPERTALLEIECTTTDAWLNLPSDVGPGAVAFLSLAYNVVEGQGTLPAESIDILGAKHNEAFSALTNESPRFFALTSLDCLHNVSPDDPGFVDACKADVDRWIGAGVIGFKDYVGGNWLPKLNRAWDFCSGGDGCMAEPGVRYLALHDGWREVLRHVVETRRAIVVTHATYNTDGHACFDPLTGSLGDCAQVTIGHLVDLAHWAEATLPPEARRRLVVAHMALALRHDRLDALEEVLEAGLSTDTSAQLEYLAGGGCELRGIFARHSEQILFGTDVHHDTITTNCLAERYRANVHLLTGRFGEIATFNPCDGILAVSPLGLDGSTADGCAEVMPSGAADAVLRDNLERLFEP